VIQLSALSYITFFTVGFVGLNNVKANDYVNVIIQALAHIPPLRDYFILQNFENKSQLGNNLTYVLDIETYSVFIHSHYLSIIFSSAFQHISTQDLESKGIQRASQPSRVAARDFQRVKQTVQAL